MWGGRGVWAGKGTPPPCKATAHPAPLADCPPRTPPPEHTPPPAPLARSPPPFVSSVISLCLHLQPFLIIGSSLLNEMGGGVKA